MSIDVQDYRALAAASFAYAVLEPDTVDSTPNPSPSPSPSECTKCGGKGWLVQGDGHKTPCPFCRSGDQYGAVGCDCEDCQCDPCECGSSKDTQGDTAAVKEDRHLLYFGAEWCGPCVKQKKILEAIKTHKDEPMTVGEGKENQIQVIDFDTNKDLAKQYGVTALPYFVTVVDGKVVHREVGGPKTEQQIREMYAK